MDDREAHDDPFPFRRALHPQADGATARPSQRSLVTRMADVQMEAINVLDRIQRGELTVPAGGSEPRR